MTEDQVFILAGPVHAGKTSFLLRFLQGARDNGLPVNGILSLASFLGSSRKGYDAFDLNTRDSYPLLRTDPDPDWLRVGPFGMIPEGLQRAEAAITDTGRSNLTVIDEMGHLELAGRGFWPGFQVVMERRQPALVVVRLELVPRFQKAIHARTHIFRFYADGLAEDMHSRLFS